jgi:hypothetical protein
MNAAQLAADHGCDCLPDELLMLVRDDDYRAFDFALAEGVREMLGVPGTGRRIRKVLPYLSIAQSQSLAHNGMARAMEEASFRKMLRLGINFKQVITAPEPCPTCRSNREQGPIPIDQKFGSGHLHAPFCVGCRCSTTAARNPCSD